MSYNQHQIFKPTKHIFLIQVQNLPMLVFLILLTTTGCGSSAAGND